MKQNQEARNEPNISGQLIFEMGAKNIHWGKYSESLLLESGNPHAKERGWTLIGCHIQKLTQNRS